MGGKVALRSSDAALGQLLERALRVEAGEPATMEHVHGFHSYAARLHPHTAHRLVEGLTRPSELVLDPFCGSGTVLVEARLLGRKALGVDANPLAVRLATLKTAGVSPAFREQLAEAAQRITDHADERRQRAAGPTHRYGERDREEFDIHVLLELDGLRDGLRRLPKGDVRRALELVLSSILTKVSRRPGDTADAKRPRRLAAGFTTRLFARKTSELGERLDEFTGLLPAGAPVAEVREGDARQLGFVRSRSVRLLLCSPPYPGVYDYDRQHATRLRWLELDARSLGEREIGARRSFSGLGAAEAQRHYEREMGACLDTWRRLLSPDGLAILVVADAALGGQAVHVDDLFAGLVARHGFELVAVASQERPHFHAPTRQAFRRKPRREHLIVLRVAASGR